MTKIHETAIIGPDVTLGEDVEIGAYCVIEGKVKIGDGCIFKPFVRTTGWIEIGNNVTVYSGAVLGEAPQDYSWNGAEGLITIGENTILREGFTVHTPVDGDKGKTTSIGSNCYLMANSHAAHNVLIHDHVTLANGCLLAGYVEVMNNVFLSGNVAVHQHCRIGAYSIAGGVSMIAQDIPPYMMVSGSPSSVRGLNLVGLRRGGFNQSERSMIKDAYKQLYGGESYKHVCDDLDQKYPDNEIISHFTAFIRESKRGIVNRYGRKK